MNAVTGPLASVRVAEFGGVGPAPFATMLLADLGADVVRVERPRNFATAEQFPPPERVLARNVRSIVLDLKDPDGHDVALRLADRADAVVEGYRPGVMERLGLGPDVLLGRNERLVFARMTGWGQTGPRAQHAGHDINYLAASGALSTIGRADGGPLPPVNLLGDFGGGGMLLAVGVLAAVLEARTSGHGQVVDVAMLDGAALLTTILQEWRAVDVWNDRRGTNFIDTGAPFYDTYPVADGSWIAIGAIEGRFWAALLDELDITEDWMRSHHQDRAYWPQIRERLAARLLELTPEDVERLEARPDACANRVLDLTSVATDAHNIARDVMVDVGGVEVPAPAPRFLRTSVPKPVPAEVLGASTAALLAELGVNPEVAARLCPPDGALPRDVPHGVSA